MADSLQDQLRALGLANKTPQERGGRKDARKGGKAARQRPGHEPGPRSDGELSLDQAYALREQEEQRLAQQTRDRKRAEERRRREINDSIRTIIEAHRLNRDDAEVARNFMFRGRIRKLYVTPEQQQALSKGQLGIVYLSGSYHVLASEHVEAVRAFSAEHVVDQQGGAENEEEVPVPDDFIW